MRDNLEAPALHSSMSSGFRCIVRITCFRLDVETVDE